MGQKDLDDCTDIVVLDQVARSRHEPDIGNKRSREAVSRRLSLNHEFGLMVAH